MTLTVVYTGVAGTPTLSQWMLLALAGMLPLVAFRAMHLSTIAGKAVTRDFYGRVARQSYFVGCSQGGHHALMEASRYPADYDGVIAGAPANYWTHLITEMIVTAMAVRTNPASRIPPAKYALIHDAVLRQCDAIADGALDDLNPNSLALVAHGFTEGLSPRRKAIGPMNTMLPVLLNAFGGGATAKGEVQ